MSQTSDFSPCPGCGNIGFTVQAWVGERKPENQMMQCSSDDCRVKEYQKITDN